MYLFGSKLCSFDVDTALDGIKQDTLPFFLYDGIIIAEVRAAGVVRIRDVSFFCVFGEHFLTQVLFDFYTIRRMPVSPRSIIQRKGMSFDTEQIQHLQKRIAALVVLEHKENASAVFSRVVWKDSHVFVVVFAMLVKKMLKGKVNLVIPLVRKALKSDALYGTDKIADFTLIVRRIQNSVKGLKYSRV